MLIAFGWLTLCAGADQVLAASSDKKIEMIVSDYSKAIVYIGVKGKDGAKMGSGFVVDREGLILTNYHIIHQAQNIFVKFKNNKAYPATIIKVDPAHDLAVLAVPADGLKAVRMGNSHGLNVGQRVVTIGHPLGLENTVSDGLISAVRRMDNGSKLLQISVPLSPGSSGGPLFDLNGKVVGITTSSFDNGQNLNFAVPITYAKSLLRRSGERSPVLEARERLTRLSHTRVLSKKEPADVSYTVQERDTLYSLSRRFKTTVEALQAINNLSTTSIHVGQVLRVPAAD